MKETPTEGGTHAQPSYNMDDTNNQCGPFTHLQWRTGAQVVTVTANEDWIAKLSTHGENWWGVRGALGEGVRSICVMCVVL